MEKAAFDMGQSTAEVDMNDFMGIEGMKSAERAAQISADAQIKAARAQSQVSQLCVQNYIVRVINTEVWKDSEAWGSYIGKADRKFMIAYWAIGIPTVKLMQRSKIAAILGPMFKQGFDYLVERKHY